jgi:alkanesulfonate monooxygenase SsuD/methylene tetrahydromethanopterin reductase-like flavin-dependent oxidoreductase (luciferase family)
MHFGLHFLFSCASHQSAQQRYRDSLEQSVHAETLGFESVWPVEHHFHAPISVMPCPSLFLAAVAARTSRLRLGTGITQLPLSHPLRVAEELATLDVLSAGRTELGIGRGANGAHYAGFGLPMQDSRERFAEGVRLLRRALTGERFSFRGQFYQVDDATLAPAPLSAPTLRVAVTSKETARFAGTEGLAIMIATHVNPLVRVRALLAAYAEARALAGHAPATSADLTLLMPLYVAESAEAARRETASNIANYRKLVLTLGEAALGKCDSAAQRAMLQPILERMGALSFEQIHAEGMGCFGSPAQCVDWLSKLRSELDPGRVIAWFNFGGLLSHTNVLRSMERFAERVMPEFQAGPGLRQQRPAWSARLRTG